MKGSYKKGTISSTHESDALQIDNNMLSQSKSNKSKIHNNNLKKKREYQINNLNSNVYSDEVFNSRNKPTANNESMNMNFSLEKIDSHQLSITSQNTCNNQNNICNLTSENKNKITIRDLCPEEKLKIGELLKRLAQEQEEKENIQKTLEEDKRNLENKINSILQEREILSTSSFPQNNSMNFKLDSFSENCEPHKIEAFSINKINEIKHNNHQSDILTDMTEIKQLKEKFSNLFDTLKKTAKTQEEYLSKIKISNDTTIEFNENRNDSSCNNKNISNNSYLMKEEKPMVLDCIPTPFIENNAQINNLGLQTSLLNINDELKGIDASINSLNFINTEKSFESPEETHVNNAYGIFSSEKLKIIKDKLNLDDHLRKKEKNELSFNNSSFSKYKSILNKVREKSKDKYQDFTDLDLQDSFKIKSSPNLLNSIRNVRCEDLSKINELKISSGVNVVQYKNNNNVIFSPNKISKTEPKDIIQDDDDKIISFLNSKDFNKNILKKQQKESCVLNKDDSLSFIESKLEIYDEKLFNLIDDIENELNKSNKKVDLFKNKEKE
jgi:hypothetical protein